MVDATAAALQVLIPSERSLTCQAQRALMGLLPGEEIECINITTCTCGLDIEQWWYCGAEGERTDFSVNNPRKIGPCKKTQENRKKN